MANEVEFKDFSMQVKAAIDDETIAWLHTWASEIEAQAKRNVSDAEWTNAERTQLRGSYANVIDESKGEAQIGSPMEQAFWEEFGTGSHADTRKNGGRSGRSGWWVYVKGEASKGGGKTYKSREEAEEAAAFLRKAKKLEAYATNGRDPNYTLEKAFTSVAPKAKKDLENILKARLEK